MRRFWFSFIISTLVLISCQEESPYAPEAPTGISSDLILNFPLSDQNRPFVSTAEVVISGADMDTIQTALTVTDSTVEGIVEEVPAGNNRHFEVFVYNASNTLTYYGAVYADVVAGQVIVLNIVLYPESVGTGTVIITGTFQDVDIQTGLIGYWPFSETADDFSGNGNHGTVYGAQLSTDAFGNPLSAYSFNGIDQYIEFGNDSVLKPSLPITMAGWVWFDRTNSRIFINNYKDDYYYGAYVSISENPSLGTLLGIGYGDGGRISPQSRRTKYIEAPEMNTWFHFVAIIRGPEDMDIYINGQNAGGAYSGSGGALLYEDGPVTVGRIDSHPQLPPYYMSGKLDEIRIYDRALNNDDAVGLYLSYF